MTPLLKVAQVLECGGPGGTGFQVAALCAGLSPARFETHLVYAVRPGSTPQEYEALAGGAARFHYLPDMVREISPLSDLCAWWKLYRLFRELCPDIVHAHSSKAGVLARTAARLARVPRIFYSPRGYAHQQSDRSAFSRFLYRFLEFSVSWIGEIVAVSESEAALARALAGPRRVRVVRDAFLGEIPPGTPRKDSGVKSDILVCALGRLSFPRHPEAFVRLAARLSKEDARLRFEWIGAGELAADVEELRLSSGAADRLTVTGWLPRDEAFRRLLGADIFVHFSRWEGLPNAVLDAMAAGLPVVASDIPGNREAVRAEHTGYIAADEEQLARHVLTLAQDPELREKMGSRGREIVRGEFSKERMLREYTLLYAGDPPAALS